MTGGLAREILPAVARPAKLTVFQKTLGLSPGYFFEKSWVFPPRATIPPFPIHPRPFFIFLPGFCCSVTPMATSSLTIGPSRGRPRHQTPDITVVRSLNEDDLPLLANPPPLNSTAPSIQSLRATHHQLAQLLVRGTSESEASLITGYSLSRISILKSDPTFAELLANYSVQRDLAFADTLDRMRVLGLSALDELQERLESSPEKWTNREVMEMAELMLVKPRLATSSPGVSPIIGSAPHSGVTVNVKFVSSDTPALVIDAKPEPNG